MYKEAFLLNAKEFLMPDTQHLDTFPQNKLYTTSVIKKAVKCPDAGRFY